VDVTWQEPPQIGILRERVQQYLEAGKQAQADALMAEACLHPRMGLWVLLRYGLGRSDAHCRWVFDRCCEVQADPTAISTCGPASTGKARSSPLR
jgi:hypothetical protein